MKSAFALMAICMAAAACKGGQSPVEQTVDPQLTLSVDSVVVDIGASASVAATVLHTTAAAQFVSRDVDVATVNESGEISGVAAGSTYVVAALANRADVRDSVRVRVKGPAPAQTLYMHQNAVAYLPPGIAEYKAAIVFLPGLRDPATGNPLDSRGLVRGTVEAACSIWCPQSHRAEVRKRALELVGGNVVLIGTTTLLDDAASHSRLLQALSAFAGQSSHPELANIPIFFVGHSMGGCSAYGFSRIHGARVAGFLTMKGGCHSPAPALAAAGVPGHFLIGAQDEQYRRDNITGVFEAGRAAGAPWAISIDPYQHGPILDFDLMFDWIDAVLAARLPETAGAPLRAVAVTGGWLGARSSGTISPYACYNSTPSSASWLPDQETALDWQRMAGGTVVVSSC